MSTGRNIKARREQQKMTQVELSKRTGITQGQISQYEKDIVRPRIDALGRIADALQCSVAVLDETLLFVPGFVKQQKGGQVDEGEPIQQSIPRFPVISEAAATECNTAYFPIADYANSNAEEFVSFSEGKKGDVVIRIKGNSMMPWYPPNTLVLVRPNVHIKTGDRVVAIMDDSSVVFKVFAEKGKKFFLFSCNQEDGQDFEFDKTDFFGVRALYKVVQSMRDESAMDAAMSNSGIRHFWEDKLDKMSEE